MKFLDDWRDRRDQRWWDEMHERTRWDRLGTYNAERSRGIVHTPEFEAEMREEQAAFRAYQHENYGHIGFPCRVCGVDNR